MTPVIIQLSSDGAMPAFFAPGRPGAASTWTEDRDQALHFARAADAQAFLECYLPQAAAYTTIVAHDPTR